jgi:hypothetical protein
VPAAVSHADGAVTNEKRGSSDDVAMNLPDLPLSLQAAVFVGFPIRIS